MGIRRESTATLLALGAPLAFVVIVMDEDDRHGVFFRRLAATVASVEVLVLAANLELLARRTWPTPCCSWPVASPPCSPSVAMLTQPSINVALAYSSAAHMGFTLMVCVVGVYPAAFLHLVAHPFYEAHAFLSSSSAIDEARASKVALPRRLNRPVRIVGGIEAAGS